MRTKVGVWIDHRKAVVVLATNHGEVATLVVSRVEKHLQRSGDPPGKGRYESRNMPSDNSRQRTLTGHLNVYYDAVIACLRDAEAILIFGPGEAKGELKKRLEGGEAAGRVAGIETTGLLSDRQIAAKVRVFFAEARPAAPRAGRARVRPRKKRPGGRRVRGLEMAEEAGRL